MTSTQQTPLLEAQGVGRSYGQFIALEGVDLRLNQGEFVSLVGPNGAGKTTLVNVLTGFVPPTHGRVHFMGRDIRGSNSVELSTRGLARAFQLVNVFPDLTVRDTLTVAACSQLGLRWRLFGDARSHRSAAEVVRATAAAFRFEDALDIVASSLPHGKRKLLDVASAFALRPKVVLLDEPTAGVSTADKHGVMETLLVAAREMNVGAILLIEHDMELVRRYSTRIVAMQGGRKIADQPTDDFFSNEEILSVVVGKLEGTA